MLVNSFNIDFYFFRLIFAVGFRFRAIERRQSLAGTIDLRQVSSPVFQREYLQIPSRK